MKQIFALHLLILPSVHTGTTWLQGAFGQHALLDKASLFPLGGLCPPCPWCPCPFGDQIPGAWRLPILKLVLGLSGLIGFGAESDCLEKK